MEQLRQQLSEQQQTVQTIVAERQTHRQRRNQEIAELRSRVADLEAVVHSIGAVAGQIKNPPG